MALSGYIVVSDGMSVVAHDTTVRIAGSVANIAETTAMEIQADVARTITDPQLQDSLAEREFMREMSLLFKSDDHRCSEFAFYDADLTLLWYSDERVLIDSVDEQRHIALETGKPTESILEQDGILYGFVHPAHLGVYIVHVPVDVPGAGRAVLDVNYFPDREEAVIDGIRVPMFTLAVSAILVMVIMMQVSTLWILKLVNDLRKAADSIDTGNLDVRLPEEGAHEIGELARSLNRLIDRLKRRADAQTRFVANASHELATPVAGIRGYTNILRAWGGNDTEVREEAIGAIDRESRRMSRLCGDLLALVRDERAVEYRSVRFDLNVRCRAILAAAATRYIDKGLEFIGPEEGQLIMVGDPDRIEDAISILVDNAAKYTDSGTVTVRTRHKRDKVIIEVVDTGSGIPAEDLPNIFDRFYRSDVSRSQLTGGFGLGLSIAKSIIDTAGGTIEVTSKPTDGTLFVLKFPRNRA
jgi:signal transduction histidine kinase